MRSRAVSLPFACCLSTAASRPSGSLPRAARAGRRASRRASADSSRASGRAAHGMPPPSNSCASASTAPGSSSRPAPARRRSIVSLLRPGVASARPPVARRVSHAHAARDRATTGGRRPALGPAPSKRSRICRSQRLTCSGSPGSPPAERPPRSGRRRLPGPARPSSRTASGPSCRGRRPCPRREASRLRGTTRLSARSSPKRTAAANAYGPSPPRARARRGRGPPGPRAGARRGADLLHEPVVGRWLVSPGRRAGVRGIELIEKILQGGGSARL